MVNYNVNGQWSINIQWSMRFNVIDFEISLSSCLAQFISRRQQLVTNYFHDPGHVSMPPIQAQAGSWASSRTWWSWKTTSLLSAFSERPWRPWPGPPRSSCGVLAPGSMLGQHLPVVDVVASPGIAWWLASWGDDCGLQGNHRLTLYAKRPVNVQPPLETFEPSVSSWLGNGWLIEIPSSWIMIISNILLTVVIYWLLGSTTPYHHRKKKVSK